ncbi:MAG: DUF6152 family protein [Steroidobacteraceae bacterium]
MAAAPLLLAHHSNAMFDATKTRVIKGTVQKFGWTNPHGYLEMEVISKSGKAQSWTVEFQSVQGMARQGLKRESFAPGDTVTVVIHPLRSGKTGGDFLGAILADGKPLGDVKELTNTGEGGAAPAAPVAAPAKPAK